MDLSEVFDSYLAIMQQSGFINSTVIPSETALFLNEVRACMRPAGCMLKHRLQKSMAGPSLVSCACGALQSTGHGG